MKNTTIKMVVAWRRAATSCCVSCYTSISQTEEFWEKNNIYPKSKINAISQLTIETILNLRCNLIDKKVSEFKNVNLDQSNVLEQVVNYTKLKRLLSEKLNRVL